MLRNYLLITWRDLYRQPIAAFLNLTCLTAGITAALLILLYVDFEVQYDHFHTKVDRIYQIRTTALNLGERVRETDMAGSPRNLAGYIKTDMPKVESCVRLFHFFQDEQVRLNYENKIIASEHIFAANPSIFDIFSIDLTSAKRIC